MNNLIRRVFQDDGQNSQLYIFIEYNNNDENFWFRGNDVAMILEYKRLNKAISKHVEPEDKKEWKNMNTQNITNLPANWQPRTLFIHEIGLYSLISGSKMDF
ncbi:putative Bro-N domain-containing protein 11 [Diachasmimorpha longicaudata entomopoxvirus]|uniref:Putative Bro-N domain-containing protein 11 n=1 Tax=Diachasmimorpha longicaudata entomopoxvirus TaxID=109981 RepID=A0A7R5WMJ2_9POXV|nr:putative Bro-N domain-containing protein 11 [Diachasmimorpha longicaudata entomopoxvirus]AKS26394.1 putative Bro-N domain-containing protein 11 [Diachasmimorpha longicaudata entomopoxvirus]